MPAVRNAPSVNVAPLAWALERMAPELLEPPQVGEALADLLARRTAALDVLADLLEEYAARTAGGER